MAKLYEFQSDLPPEQLLRILSIRAKRRTQEGLRLRVRGSHITLNSFGTWGGKGQIPFAGTVQAERSGSVLRDGFSLWTAQYGKLALILWLLMTILGALFGVPVLIGAASGALWPALCAGLLTLVSRSMGQCRRKVLDFLETEAGRRTPPEPE